MVIIDILGDVAGTLALEKSDSMRSVKQIVRDVETKASISPHWNPVSTPVCSWFGFTPFSPPFNADLTPLSPHFDAVSTLC